MQTSAGVVPSQYSKSPTERHRAWKAGPSRANDLELTFYTSSIYLTLLRHRRVSCTPTIFGTFNMSEQPLTASLETSQASFGYISFISLSTLARRWKTQPQHFAAKEAAAGDNDVTTEQKHLPEHLFCGCRTQQDKRASAFLCTIPWGLRMGNRKEQTRGRGSSRGSTDMDGVVGRIGLERDDSRGGSCCLVRLRARIGAG